MANVHELPVQPDESVMLDMVNALFAHALRGKVELAWTGPEDNGGLNQARLFDLTELDALAAHATRVNVNPNRNVYVSAGLRREDAPDDARASKSDVILIAALKADCDEPGCLTTAINAACDAGFPPNLAYFTGKTPHLRGSLWWVLEDPETDLPRVEAIEVRLAALFKSDPAVHNPDRVMRLAGSVAWPRKKGRVLEMTGRYGAAVTRRAPYTLDELEGCLDRIAAPQQAPPLLDLSTARPTKDIESMLADSVTPEQFQINMLPAVASLIKNHVPPDTAFAFLAGAIRMAGVNVPQRVKELRGMVRSAAEKYAPKSAEALTTSPDRDPFPLIPLAEIGMRGPPEWRIQGIIPKRGFGVLYGASGTYKSFIALDLALTLAHGLPWRGKPTEQAGAAYIAGEGTYSIQNRVVAWRAHRGQDTPDAPFWLAPVASNFLDPPTVRLISERLSALPVRVIIVDTLARSFGAGNENDAQDMNRFVAACDYLANTCDAFVLAIHHSGKEADKGARGSSALRAAADVELSVTKGLNDACAVLEVTKMKDAEDGQRIRIRMVEVDGVFPVTGETVTSLAPVITEDEEPVIPTARVGKHERTVLALLDEGGMKFGTLKARSGIDSGTLGRTLRTLSEKNYVLQSGEDWMLTSGAVKNFEETL